MYYGKGLFYEDALNILYAEHYGAILEKEKDNFTAVGDPSLSVDDISDEKVVLIAEVPVKPDVEIETYKGIKIPEFVYTVSDADVDKDIEDTRLRLAKDEDVTRPRRTDDGYRQHRLCGQDGRQGVRGRHAHRAMTSRSVPTSSSPALKKASSA